jgi:hypothetical protein
MTCNGGAGGASSNGGGVFSLFITSGGSASGGNILNRTGDGASGAFGDSPVQLVMPSNGAPSPFGAGGASNFQGTGSTGAAGAGGGGTTNLQSQGSGRSGGAGGNGMVIITEFIGS